MSRLSPPVERLKWNADVFLGAYLLRVRRRAADRVPRWSSIDVSYRSLLMLNSLHLILTMLSEVHPYSVLTADDAR